MLGHPELAVYQFPVETYRRCAYSVAELEMDLQACGRLGAWLWRRVYQAAAGLGRVG